jgi:ABC-type spermidine/putrescine transport system permease subunit I
MNHKIILALAALYDDFIMHTLKDNTGNLIEQQLMQAGNWHFGSAASLIMMTIILLAMQFMNRFDKTQQKNMEMLA